MSKFRKKPVVIEAIQFIGGWNSVKEIEDWSRGSGREIVGNMENDSLSVPTLEGIMTANVGDWIIKGVKGEFYPCKPDIFHKTYDIKNR